MNASRAGFVVVAALFSAALGLTATGVSAQGADWGDAPDSYRTLSANNGARHNLNVNYRLGAQIDAEADGQPDALAMGDDLNPAAGPDDEDGVSFNTLVWPGSMVTVTVTFATDGPAGFLDGWMDFGADGSWAEAGDKIFSGVPLTPGANTLAFAVPGTAAAGVITYLRFRLSPTGNIPYDGAASGYGEVEDYAVMVHHGNPKWVQYPDLTAFGLDVNVTDPSLAADDFLCRQTGPITGLSVFASWYHDVLPQGSPGNVTIVLSIFSDVPAGASFSHPGTALWTMSFAPGQFVVQPRDSVAAGWYDPLGGIYEPNADYQGWWYMFPVPPGQEFIQTNGTVYWLKMHAVPADPATKMGWQTAMTHWNDDATRGWWNELRYPPGHPQYPQSIDLAFAIDTGPSQPRDYGDAIDCYHTMKWNNGPSHVIGGPWLGGPDGAPDSETDGQANPWALGDDQAGVDDENGVAMPLAFRQGETSNLTITVSGGGWVEAWIDWNEDCTFDHPAEQVLAENLAPGVYIRPVTAPANAVIGTNFARFRISTAGGLAPWGPAADGEVEDYAGLVLSGSPPPSSNKWEQPPDLTTNGMDVAARYPLILADDFRCDRTGPITNIAIWGSWSNDFSGATNVVFTLSLHADIPAGSNGYSRPGAVLWWTHFNPGQFTSVLWNTGREGWFDPRLNRNIMPGDSNCWRYSFAIDPSNAYVQSSGTVYWLDVQASQLLSNARFGWKTSTNHWNDDAVWGQGMEPYSGSWTELRYPSNHLYYSNSIDLAFAIQTGEAPTGGLDWGDAPDPTYPTLAANNGARHVIGGPWLGGAGGAPDSEPNGQPQFAALGDDNAGVDDENGVVLPLAFRQWQTSNLTITVSGGGWVQGWIDWNQNGAWEHPAEQVLAENLAPGVYVRPVTAPGNAMLGTNYSRFRISTAGGLAPWGSAADGEVEDYREFVYNGSPPPSSNKWEQPPDLTTNGMDVSATDPLILADDFRCDRTGPITNIVIWGSWSNDYGNATNVAFTLSLHADIPAGASYSRPGAVLWSMPFHPGQFTRDLWNTGREGWFDPRLNWNIMPGDSNCWRYSFAIAASNAMVQTSGSVYWLDVQAFPIQGNARFGWKSSTNHWNDDAVWGEGAEPYAGPWTELRYPPNHGYYSNSIDLAFAIQTGEAPTGGIDWGDAPDPTYPTLAANNGAGHVIGGPWLGGIGGAPDSEPNGQPDPAALGDDNAGVDDENGVVLPLAFLQGQTSNLTITVSGGGWVEGWIDWNQNGAWEHPAEQVLSANLGAAVYTVPVTAPANAVVGATFVRFRISTAGGLTPWGMAGNGEVEDYRGFVTNAPPPVFSNKWEQPPDLTTNGMDVSATDRLILADDFRCGRTGPITNIVIWGSWSNDFGSATNVAFTLSLHADIPAGSSYSRPGAVLWTTHFNPGQFSHVLWSTGREGWFDPRLNWNIMPGDSNCWRYSFAIAASNAYVQSSGTVYWLDVQAIPIQSNARFGWKSSTNHWNDDAVWGQGVEPFAGPWTELRYPPNHVSHSNSIDLAFAIETGEYTPSGYDCGDAPPGYPTLIPMGAFHTIGGPWLGGVPDAESDGQANANATGDDSAGFDDENGVGMPLVFRQGQTTYVPVNVGNGPAWVQAWIDWNRVSAWEPAEQVMNFYALASGPYSVPVTAPWTAAPGTTFARFRISTAGSLLPIGGPAPDGEVEDYALTVEKRPESAKWWKGPDCLRGVDLPSWTNLANGATYAKVADDWLCNGYRIAAIRWWGSYIGYDGDATNLPSAMRPTNFILTMYKDIPKSIFNSYSRPGAAISSVVVGPVVFNGSNLPPGTVSERYYCTTDLNKYMPHMVERDYEYHVTLPSPWLEAKGKVYWLSVQARYAQAPVPANYWGWLTTRPPGWNDDAVSRTNGATAWQRLSWPPKLGPWGDLLNHPYAKKPYSVDTAFALYTDVIPRRSDKWAQASNLSNLVTGAILPSYTPMDELGTGAWPIRADDFRSDGRRITDIHWQGSYVDYETTHSEALPPQTTPLAFKLSWYADVPGGAYSQPNNPPLREVLVPYELCHEVYSESGTQSWNQASNVVEHEFAYYVDLQDPQLAVGPWYETAGTVYWLGVQAVFSNGWRPGDGGEHRGWGWRTAGGTGVWNGASVVATNSGVPAWEVGAYPPGHPSAGQPADLAFTIGTDEMNTQAVIRVGAYENVDENLALLGSEGEAGTGVQILQTTTNLPWMPTWFDLETNWAPMGWPDTNWWMVPQDYPLQFFRVLQQAEEPPQP